MFPQTDNKSQIYDNYADDTKLYITKSAGDFKPIQPLN